MSPLTPLTTPIPLASNHTSHCPPPGITPDANGWVPPGTCGFLSRPYYPSFSAAVVFAFIAAVLVGGYVLAIVRVRSRWTRGVNAKRGGEWWEMKGEMKGEFLVPGAGGTVALALLTAYVLRVASTRDMQVVGYIAGSDVLVLVCPILTSGLACIVLGRLIAIVLPEQSDMFHRLHLVAVPLIFMIQLIAAVLIIPKHVPNSTTSAAPTAMIGIKWYIFGLALHLALHMFALTLASFIYKRLPERRSSLDSKQEDDSEGEAWKTKRRVLYAVLFSLGAVTVRVVYRLVELGGLLNGYLTGLASNELYFYALECAPVVVGAGIWAVVTEGTSILAGKKEGDYVYEEVSGEAGDEEGVVMKEMGVER